MLPVLPIEIVNKIFLFIQGSSLPAIKAELDIYDNDHNYEYTKIYRRFFIKNILPFSDYYFDKRFEPQYYNSYTYGLDREE